MRWPKAARQRSPSSNVGLPTASRIRSTPRPSVSRSTSSANFSVAELITASAPRSRTGRALASLDTLPSSRPPHALADGLDHARRLHARRVGQLRLRHVGALAEAGVGEVHADRVRLNEHHARPHVRPGHLRERQHLGTSGLREDDRLHPGSLPRAGQHTREAGRRATVHTGGAMRLPGRVAAITGGALGIGRATARLFAAEGAAVALGDVEVGAAETVAKEIVNGGGRAIAVGVDVGDAGQVQAFVDRVVAELGRLDIMFANAGIAHSAPFLEHPEAQWHRVLRVNLTGVFLCCQAAARQMVKQGGGRIITTASINGFRGVENLVGYNAAKAGVIELTKTMAVELARHHIAVNAIAPAQIDT